MNDSGYVPIAPQPATSSKALDLTKTLLSLVAIVAVPFFAYISLAEEHRATQRWESPAFNRVVVHIVDDELTRRDLATKEDIHRLEDRISDISNQLTPITTFLIQENVIK